LTERPSPWGRWDLRPYRGEPLYTTVQVVTLHEQSALQSWWVRRPPVPARSLGIRQLALGLVVVGATATGVRAL
jgi:hypothetical protein